MLKKILILIIIYIIAQQFMSDTVVAPSETLSVSVVKSTSLPNAYNSFESKSLNTLINTNEPRANLTVISNNPPEIIKAAKTIEKTTEKSNKTPKQWDFDRPNPWTKIIYDETDDYPYHYYIKISIPSLNDFQSWKQVVPNLNFDPQTGELIIPSKEESSALALANLICINFAGQLTLEDILNKNLIQISITKAKTHDVVQTKLREQIMETLYGKSYNKTQTNYEKDLAKNNVESNRDIPPRPTRSQPNTDDRPNFQNEGFSDTFEHFGSTKHKQPDEGFLAYDGGDYAYL
jgi:hypothetical protein